MFRDLTGSTRKLVMNNRRSSFEFQLTEEDIRPLESLGVISIQTSGVGCPVDSNANLRRAVSWLVNCDCAMITAWRKSRPDGTPKTRIENDNDNKTLVQKLRDFGYGVSKVQGCYQEIGHPLSRENSFLVFDLLNDSELFFERIFNLSTLFLQDSFLYKRAGVNTVAYEIGTNEAFGLNKRKPIGTMRVGVCTEGIFSKIGSGTITFE